MSSLQETVILFIGIITFIILRIVLLKLFKGQKRKLYEQATKNGCTVNAYSIKEHHVMQDRSETREKYRSAKNRTVYLYEVNGKRYKKVITYIDNVNIYAASPSRVTLYYDPIHPKKAVTEDEAFSVRHKLFISMLAFIIMILVINIMVKIATYE